MFFITFPFPSKFPPKYFPFPPIGLNPFPLVKNVFNSVPFSSSVITLVVVSDTFIFWSLYENGKLKSNVFTNFIYFPLYWFPPLTLFEKATKSSILSTIYFPSGNVFNFSIYFSLSILPLLFVDCITITFICSSIPFLSVSSLAILD